MKFSKQHIKSSFLKESENFPSMKYELNYQKGTTKSIIFDVKSIEVVNISCIYR